MSLSPIWRETRPICGTEYDITEPWEVGAGLEIPG